MPTLPFRMSSVLAVAAALAAATAGATSNSRVETASAAARASDAPRADTAQATTVTLPACRPTFAEPPATDRTPNYTLAIPDGTVEVTAAVNKTVEVRTCFTTGEPAKVKQKIIAFKAPKSARYVSGVVETTTVRRDGSTAMSIADLAVPLTEKQFDGWLRRIPHRVELKVPGIGSKVYGPRCDLLTTIAKRRNGKRITDDQRSNAAERLMRQLREASATK